MNNFLYDWDNVTIIPAILSEISSREEINIHRNGNKLPLFIAPMDTVVDVNNYSLFSEMGFEVCLPRGEGNIFNEGIFISYGLDEIIEAMNNTQTLPKRLLIDIANGHMKRLHDTAKRIKSEYPNTELMIGNVANPKTYSVFSAIGVDYVRVGIGGGSACTTSANAAIHYPMASLISECYEEKANLTTPAKIVADGGFRKFPDIIKALALGADYVMLGGIINKSLESCSPCYVYNDKMEIFEEVSLNDARIFMKNNQNVYKYFRGMSTKEVQTKWGKSTLKTSEGITKYNKVEYTIEGWVENFSDYLKTNMSYSNKRSIEDYIGKADFRFITPEAYARYNK